MDNKREHIEELRLLRALSKISDPERRREILELAEKYTPPKPQGSSAD
jgi:hypothetical protein